MYTVNYTHARTHTHTLTHTHSLKDNENGNLAPAMNGVVVHSKMVDNFQELLIEQTDLSFMW